MSLNREIITGRPFCAASLFANEPVWHTSPPWCSAHFSGLSPQQRHFTPTCSRLAPRGHGDRSPMASRCTCLFLQRMDSGHREAGHCSAVNCHLPTAQHAPSTSWQAGFCLLLQRVAADADAVLTSVAPSISALVLSNWRSYSRLT